MRISLAPCIADLQAIRRQYAALEPDPCVAALHDARLAQMDATIEGYLAFLREESDSVVEKHLQRAGKYEVLALALTEEIITGVPHPTATPDPVVALTAQVTDRCSRTPFSSVSKVSIINGNMGSTLYVSVNVSALSDAIKKNLADLALLVLPVASIDGFYANVYNPYDKPLARFQITRAQIQQYQEGQLAPDELTRCWD